MFRSKIIWNQEAENNMKMFLNFAKCNYTNKLNFHLEIYGVIGNDPAKIIIASVIHTPKTLLKK